MPSGASITGDQLDERCLDLGSQVVHGGKARLAFDQTRPTCDYHLWNRPDFGVVDVMHVFRATALGQASVGLFELQY